MSYSQLKLEDLKRNFDLIFREEVDLFDNITEIKPSSLLTEILQNNVPLAIAIGTEKARSELIVSPVLVALRKHFNNQISLFSGVEFNIDSEKGLNGICDFMISQSAEQLFIQAPVVTLVEAKNDNIKLGMAQCLGEMLAAQIFNQRQNNNIDTIYGVITTGTIWQFLTLNKQNVQISLDEYSLKQLPLILGILAKGLQ